MLKRSILLLGIVLFSLEVFSQNQTNYFLNAEKIDPNRYEDIQGNPMLFKTWTKATLYDKKEKPYYVELNYNGLTQTFEVKKSETEFINLNGKDFNRVEIEDESAANGIIIFKQGIFPKAKNDFVAVIFKSERFQAIKHFRVRKVTSTINDVGKIRTLESFSRNTDYYFVEDGKASILRLKKKPLLKELGEEKKLSDFIKKENIDLKSDADLSKLFLYYSQL